VINILYKPPLKYYLLFQLYFVERWLQECLIIIKICVWERWQFFFLCSTENRYLVLFKFVYVFRTRICIWSVYILHVWRSLV